MAPLTLALEIDGDGAHPAAWRRAAHPPGELLTPGRVRHIAELAERAGFTLVTLDDDLLPPAGPAGRIGAVERAAFIAASTSVLSVAPAVSTTYSEPFHVSSQLATVDHLAAGRAGWIVGTSPAPEAALAWGRAAVTGEDAVRREAADAVHVVRDLWDSWEDDAVIRDVASSRYLDRDRLHYIDFIGETYSVKGPAIVPRPPQGQLVVFAPPGLPADVALLAGIDVAAVRTLAATAKTPRTFAEVEVALSTAVETGAERVAVLDHYTPWPHTGRQRYVGGPTGLVALLHELAGVVDGVRLHPLVLDEDLAVLSQHVIPALLRSRTIARPLPGATLRQSLGLPRPQSRFQEVTA